MTCLEDMVTDQCAEPERKSHRGHLPASSQGPHPAQGPVFDDFEDG